jgi:hypothetical protein
VLVTVAVAVADAVIVAVASGSRVGTGVSVAGGIAARLQALKAKIINRNAADIFMIRPVIYDPTGK